MKRTGWESRSLMLLSRAASGFLTCDVCPKLQFFPAHESKMKHHLLPQVKNTNDPELLADELGNRFCISGLKMPTAFTFSPLPELLPVLVTKLPLSALNIQQGLVGDRNMFLVSS